MSERVAILVIHGVGQERPYETLDKFTRNLQTSLNTPRNSWTVKPDLQSVPDPSRNTKAWIQASYILSPDPAQPPPRFTGDPGSTIEDISLFEYYWAPITQNKITYTGSLLFLINAGLKPFLYLASNLSVLTAAEKAKRFFWILLKELFRQAFLFLPLVLLLGYLLAALNSLSLDSLLKMHIAGPLIATAVLLGIRYLYLYSSWNALLDSISVRTGWRSSIFWRGYLVLAVLFSLFAWPFLLSGFLECVAWLGTRLAHCVSFLPDLLGHWSGRLRQYAGSVSFSASRSPADKWKRFFLLDSALYPYVYTAFLVLLAFVAKWILVDYVGDVAVYVDVNELSKSYAARTQILEECSAMLADLLLRQDGNGNKVYDRVLIASHSLGTVIAYDAMNVLVNAARTSTCPSPKLFHVVDALPPRPILADDLNNLRGLLTFGCPLNKIFYFFREQGDPQLTLRNQTLDMLSGFRRKPQVNQADSIPMFTPSPDLLWPGPIAALGQGFVWVNVYSTFDPISGKIVFYDVDAQYHLMFKIPFVAHVEYWNDQLLYSYFRQHML